MRVLRKWRIYTVFMTIVFIVSALVFLGQSAMHFKHGSKSVLDYYAFDPKGPNLARAIGYYLPPYVILGIVLWYAWRPMGIFNSSEDIDTDARQHSMPNTPHGHAGTPAFSYPSVARVKPSSVGAAAGAPVAIVA